MADSVQRVASAALLAVTLLLALPGTTAFRVQLSKQHVPVQSNGRVVMNKTAYYGSLYVGLPQAQEFSVVFDTGSGHIILPSSECDADPCKSHRQYDRSLSTSAADINFDGEGVASPGEAEEAEEHEIMIQYGTGHVIGPVTEEVVCMGAEPAAKGLREALNQSTSLPEHCMKVWTVMANEMSSDPFAEFAFDGVFGLGLPGLALEANFHALSRLSQDRKIPPIFGIFLSRSDLVSSEIAFGDLDKERMAGDFHWEPVVSPEHGFWRINITSVAIGGVRVPICDDGQCSAILDSGTSMLGVPQEVAQDFFMLTARPAGGKTDCRNVAGPTLSIGLTNTNVELLAEEYSRPAPTLVVNSTTNATQEVCRASILPVAIPPLGSKVFLLGEPVLQRYYTAYDVRLQRVGFARALHPTPEVEGAGLAI